MSDIKKPGKDNVAAGSSMELNTPAVGDAPAVKNNEQAAGETGFGIKSLGFNRVSTGY